jgi:hypothetical protein
MKSPLEYLKYVVLGVAALYLASSLFPRSYPPTQMQIDVFEALPVSDGGRTKPWGTVAEVNLMAISGRRSFTESEAGKPEVTTRQPAIKWLLDLMTSEMYPYPDEVAHYKIFRIEDEKLLRELGLPRRDLYAYADFETKLNLVLERTKTALRNVKEKPISDEDEALFTKAYGLLSQTDSVLGLARGPSAGAKVFHIEND